ncbi:hypothetical protein [Lihuaxuella thermophila]|uniref:Uncharacterized protein n=1 Tax=Lihuaxuella thermophila TaxID=1173111 RepID=A0A1H8ASC8_9BACL|nr:hypothetical protein [Lihuaxuella thermophila]SEM73671.1 hypothetical protein SAMN05444955_101327 [Lihuaxuella thermophila]
MKELQIMEKLKEMRVGEPIHFSTKDPDVFLEVDRVFVGMNEGWVIYHQGQRLIMEELKEAARYIAQHWNLNLKKLMDQQYSQLEEIVDLGEY